MNTLFNLVRSPLALLVASLLVLGVAAWIGARHARRLRAHVAAAREDFDIILGATLTLLALIIGFTFSMALSRYDQRKDYEEAEANAIGTEYLRADLLAAADAGRLRALLRDYAGARMEFYTTRDADALARLDARTARLQAELWSVVRGPATAAPTPVMALVLSGANDVLNAQGYTQAAWSNRIPGAAWLLLFAIATCSVLLVGVRLREPGRATGLLLILPIVIAVAFFLIADIDSPRRGLIRVGPEDLTSLAHSLGAP